MAAILAAGMGCAALGVLAFLGATSSRVKGLLGFPVPTGPLSGVTTLAIAIRLTAGFALTFPPTIDLLRGN